MNCARVTLACFYPLATFTLLSAQTSLVAVEAPLGSYLAFACDGSAREQLTLFEKPGSWVINQNRAFDPKLGSVTYRVPVGHALIDQLQLELNQVPYRLEFSADGAHWENLISMVSVASKPMEFSTHGTGFTDVQRKAANASGYTWLRLRSATESQSEVIQLKYFRLDVRGAEVPPHFVRPAWWRELSPHSAGPFMIAVALVPIAVFWRRWGASPRIWLGGAALWVIAVVLKGGIAFVANAPLQRWMVASLGHFWANLAFWSYIGLLTGIFECGIFLVVAPLIKRKRWTSGEALALGLGFGAVEALVLGVVVVFTGSQAGVWSCLSTWSDALVPAFERLVTLPIHTAAAVMILRALVERQWRWFWASFVYKSAVDGVAAWLILSGTSLISRHWLMEWICFAPFALLGLVILIYLRRIWSGPTATRISSSLATGQLHSSEPLPKAISPG